MTIDVWLDNAEEAVQLQDGYRGLVISCTTPEEAEHRGRLARGWPVTEAAGLLRPGVTECWIEPTPMVL